MYVSDKLPRLSEHFSADEYFTFEAAFTSQLITLFVYDASYSVSLTVLELFLLEGE